MDKTSLMEKVIAGNASIDEQKEFEVWLLQSEQNKIDFARLKWMTENADETERDPDDPFYDGLKNIKNKMHVIQKRRKLLRLIKLILLTVFILIFLYFLFHQLGFWTSSKNNWHVNLNLPSYTLAVSSDAYAPYSQI